MDLEMWIEENKDDLMIPYEEYCKSFIESGYGDNPIDFKKWAKELYSLEIYCNDIDDGDDDF